MCPREKQGGSVANGECGSGSRCGLGARSPLPPPAWDTRERCRRSASSSFCTRRAIGPYALFARFHTRPRLLGTKSPLFEQVGCARLEAKRPRGKRRPTGTAGAGGRRASRGAGSAQPAARPRGRRRARRRSAAATGRPQPVARPADGARHLPGPAPAPPLRLAPPAPLTEIAAARRRRRGRAAPARSRRGPGGWRGRRERAAPRP